MTGSQNSSRSSLVSILASRERYRDQYWRKHDPILDDRLFWRAQTFRHTVHLLPSQAILELGCGGLRFTRALLRVSRKANPITSVTFQSSPPVASDVVSDVELIQLCEFPGPLAGRQFDYIIAMDLLDRSSSSELLEAVHKLLAPGGEILFYESNPWNPMRKLRALLLKLVGKPDTRNLIDRPGLYELLSEIGHSYPARGPGRPHRRPTRGVSELRTFRFFSPGHLLLDGSSNVLASHFLRTRRGSGIAPFARTRTARWVLFTLGCTFRRRFSNALLLRFSLVGECDFPFTSTR